MLDFRVEPATPEDCYDMALIRSIEYVRPSALDHAGYLSSPS
jgi:hypothetical protein